MGWSRLVLPPWALGTLTWVLGMEVLKEEILGFTCWYLPDLFEPLELFLYSGSFFVCLNVRLELILLIFIRRGGLITSNFFSGSI